MNDTKVDFALLRTKAGISVDEAAVLCGKTKRTIYRWENGETKPEKLAVEKLEGLADCLVLAM